MTRIVLLDSGPLGLLTNPRPNPEAQLAKKWLDGLRMSGIQVLVPEIADYEVRRELYRAGKMRGIQNLEQLTEKIGYIPLNTTMLRQAAVFWASLRQLGLPTSDVDSLDGDVILAAQSLHLSVQGNEVVIATTNVKHLERLVPAQFWKSIVG